MEDHARLLEGTRPSKWTRSSWTPSKRRLRSAGRERRRRGKTSSLKRKSVS